HEARAEAPEARQQVLLQRVTDEWISREVDELLQHRNRRGQELRLHQTRERDQRPQREEAESSRDRQRPELATGKRSADLETPQCPPGHPKGTECLPSGGSERRSEE